MKRAILLDEKDNVATMLAEVKAGEVVEVGGTAAAPTITAAQVVPAGHKIALRQIGAGETIVKYGQPIGGATQVISPGEHVHTHNAASRRGKERQSGMDAE